MQHTKWSLSSTFFFLVFSHFPGFVFFVFFTFVAITVFFFIGRTTFNYDWVLATVLSLTLFQERCLWREKHHRMDWPSNGFPNEPFCSPCQPIVGHDGGWRVYVRYGDLLACLKHTENELAFFLVVSFLKLIFCLIHDYVKCDYSVEFWKRNVCAVKSEAMFMRNQVMHTITSTESEIPSIAMIETFLCQYQSVDCANCGKSKENCEVFVTQNTLRMEFWDIWECFENLVFILRDSCLPIETFDGILFVEIIKISHKYEFQHIIWTKCNAMPAKC